MDAGNELDPEWQGVFSLPAVIMQPVLYFRKKKARTNFNYQ